MNETLKAPKWFMIVAIVALAWNLIGLAAFVAEMMMTPEAMAALPEAQQELYRTQPGWLPIVFAGSVIAGTLGALALVLRKGWALPMFVVSFVCLLAQQYYMWVMSNMVEVMGTGAMILPLMVLAIAAFLIWVSGFARGKRWLSNPG